MKRLGCMTVCIILTISSIILAQDSQPTEVETRYQILFTSYCQPGSPPETKKIYSVYLDGSNLRHISDLDEYAAHESNPRWSPDGQQVAFDMRTFYPPAPEDYRGIDEESSSEIYFTDVVKETTSRLTFDLANYTSPKWSSTGLIAFGNGQIFTIDPKSANPKPVLLTAGFSFNWSPDGENIAFLRGDNGDYSLFVIAVESEILQQLTSQLSVTSPPEWSPDGQYLLFAARRDGQREIYRIDKDGSNLVKLTESSGDKYIPRWAPDGQRIAFWGDKNTIYIVEADGSNPVMIQFPYKVRYPNWLADGTGLVFSMEDGALTESCPYPGFSLYWLDIACLETSDGCSAEDSVRIPHTEMIESNGLSYLDSIIVTD